MPVLSGVLKTDRMDVEIVKMTMETLNNLCSKEKKYVEVSLDPSTESFNAGKTGGNGATSQEDLGGMFAEIFVKVSFMIRAET